MTNTLSNKKYLTNNDLILNEFYDIYERSKELFQELKDLPTYGHVQWRNYYARAFDVHTKLWRFQQKNRMHLEKNNIIERWEIGDMASRIGQLYYHYYLRTSDPAYLKQSFSFYSAIRQRKYFSISAEHQPKKEISLKKLRYFIHFCLICVLLREHDILFELLEEMEKEIIQYSIRYEASNLKQGNEFSRELREFYQCVNIVNVLHPLSNQSTRLDFLNVRALPLITMSTELSGARLSEVVIVGSVTGQVKVGEMTVDMYRMLMLLERDPTVDSNQNNLSQAINPHKYLLFHPTESEFKCFLSAAYNELPMGGVLLVYLSMDAADRAGPPVTLPSSSSIESQASSHVGFEGDGLYTSVQSLPHSLSNTTGDIDPHRVYPGDLLGYTRRPLFLIIESNCINAFQKFPSVFGQPLVVFLAAEKLPASLMMSRLRGGLLTLFLHHPLCGLCVVCDALEIKSTQWNVLHQLLMKFLTDCVQWLLQCKSLPDSFRQFMNDPFLCALIARFVFCGMVLRLHRGIHSECFCPTSQPDLGDISTDIYRLDSLRRCVIDMAGLIDRKYLFTGNETVTNAV